MIAPRRSGYTLLEVLLATAIGVLLLAAVYVAVDVQFSSAQSGRDMIEQSTLARSLLTRMGEDINLSLGTVDPSRYRSSRRQSGGSSGQTGSTASSGTTSSTGGTSNTNTGAANTNTNTSTNTTSTTNSAQSSDSENTTQSSTAQNGVVTFNLFVQGTDTSLTLYVSRYPREFTVNPADPESLNAQLILSDLRRITYWLAGGVDSPLGLAKQELKIATAEDADATAPRPPEGVEDEASFVIAEEVRSLKFSYFDGTDWLAEWYGDVIVNNFPKGPPLAIAIEMEVAPPGSVNKPNSEVLLRKFRHVVAIPVANGISQQATQQATEQQMSTTTP